MVHNVNISVPYYIILPTKYDHTADCRVPVSNAKLNYNSTLEGSVLILTCENDTSTDKQTLNVTCHSNGSWIPDPADFICSESSFTVPPGSYLSYEEHKLLLLYITVRNPAW